MMQKIMIAVVVFLLIIYISGSWFFADLLIAGETATLAEDIERSQQGHNWNVPEPEIVVISSGDVDIVGNFYANEAAGDCAVVMLHGYTGTRYGSLHYGPLFWERGCHLFAYDARGHGESGDAYHTYGYYEKEDALAAYQWVQARTNLSNDQIGLIGVSYGAATSVQMLAIEPDIAFVLADSAYQDLQTIIKQQAVKQFGTWTAVFVPGAFLISELRADFDTDDVSPQNAIAASETPVLLIHAIGDTFTPSTHSEAIYANGDPTRTQLYITDWGADHGESILVDYDAFATLVDTFLAEYVPDFGDA